MYGIAKIPPVQRQQDLPSLTPDDANTVCWVHDLRVLMVWDGAGWAPQEGLSERIPTKVVVSTTEPQPQPRWMRGGWWATFLRRGADKC